MGSIREKLSDLTSIGIADVSAKGVSAIFWFYIASTLGPEGYGQITYFLSVAMIASTVSLLGAANTLVVYTAKNVRIQPAIYVLTLISGTVTSIVVFFIFFNVGASSLILGYVIFILVTSELLGQKIYKNYSKFVITQRVLMVILGLGMFYLLGEDGILLGIAISYLVYVFGIARGFKKYKIDFRLIKDRFNFIINSYLQTLAATLNGSLDKLIILPLFGYALLGNYSLGLQFLTVLQILPVIVSKYIISQDSSGIENKKLKKIAILVSIGLATIGLSVGPIAVSVIFPKFIEADEVIRIVSISLVPGTIGLMYHSKFLGQEKSRKVLISSMIWVGTQILGIIVLGTIYGINGIAASLVLGATASAIYVVLADKFEK